MPQKWQDFKIIVVACYVMFSGRIQRIEATGTEHTSTLNTNNHYLTIILIPVKFMLKYNAAEVERGNIVV